MTRISPPTRFRARVTTGLVLTLTILLALLGAPTPEASAETNEQPAVEVVSINPAILKDQTEIEVKVRLRVLPEQGTARVALFMGADSLQTNQQVEAFLEDGGYVWNVAEIMLTEDQRMRASTEDGVEVSLKASVEELPLWNVDDWGPYGVEVRSLGHVPGSFAATASARSLLLWYGSDTRSGLNLNLIAPGPEGIGGARLSDTLGVTTPTTETELLSMDATDPSSGDALLLPAGNADLSVISAANAGNLAELAITSLGEPAGSYQNPLVARALLTSRNWFCSDVFAVSGAYPVISPPGGDGAADALPPGNYAVQGSRDGHSQLLVETWSALENIVQEEATSESEVFLKQQRLRAVTALEAKSLGSEETYLVANLLDPELSDLRAGTPPQPLRSDITAMLDAPWVIPVPLQDVLDAPATNIEASSLSTEPLGDQSALEASLAPVESALALAIGTLGIGEDDQDVPSDLKLTALAPTAAGLNLEARADIAEEAASEIRKRYDVIDIAPSRTVNVLSNEAEFPVTLSNRGDTDAKVRAGLRVSDPRLSAEEWVEALVPAHSSATANVPIIALASGNVDVVVEVTSTNGTLLDSSEPFLVRVRPWLGDTLTWVTGSALATLFLVGIYRTVRQGRRGVRTRPENVPGKDGE